MIEIVTEKIKKGMKVSVTSADMQENKVKELKKSIAKGTYEVDASKIVDGIFKEAVRDCLSKEKN